MNALYSRPGRTRMGLLAAIALLSGLLLASTLASSAQALSPPAKNGLLAFTRGQTVNLGDPVVPHRIFTMGQLGENLKQISDGGGQWSSEDLYPSYSWNGQKIAFTRTTGKSTNIAVMDADGTDDEFVTFGLGNKYEPVFTPDGSRLIYAGDQDGDFELYSIKVDGTGQVKLTSNGVDDISPSITDSGLIYFSRDGEIMKLKKDGRVSKLTTAGGYTPSVSRDGSTVVFASNRDGNAEIYRMNGAGTAETRITFDNGGDLMPKISPDGKKVAFCSNGFPMSDPDFWNFDVATINLDGTGLKQITKLTRTDVSPAWQPVIGIGG